MKVKNITYAEKDEAVAVLASAFYNYPLMRYVLKASGKSYKQHLDALIDFFCETRLTRNWPLLGLMEKGKIVAVAGINEPIDKPWPQKLHDIYRELQLTIGEESFARLENYENLSSVNEPEEPHYFLGIIGVLPSFHGQDFAKCLINELQKMSLKNIVSTGICLHTEDSNNVQIYEHLGFRIIGKMKIDDVQNWCMFRPDDDSQQQRNIQN
jgi:GNAT superfamily N-acetyltransferase